MTKKVNFNIKLLSISLNAANQWIEDYSREKNPNKSILYIPEIKQSLLFGLNEMVPESPMREDFTQLIESIKNVDDARSVCHQLMSMFCYYLAISDDAYIARPEKLI